MYTLRPCFSAFSLFVLQHAEKQAHTPVKQHQKTVPTAQKKTFNPQIPQKKRHLTHSNGLFFCQKVTLLVTLLVTLWQKNAFFLVFRGGV